MDENSMHWPSTAAREFEDEYDIKIPVIRDYGSRSKNMDGPDSDIDAMFIFDQPAMDHKLLNEYTDTIHDKKYGVDFQGWNIRKFAHLLKDSNPSAISFLNSDKEYYTIYGGKNSILDSLEELRIHANRRFNPIRLYMHHRSKAKDNYEKYILRKLIGQNGESGQYIITDSTGDKYDVNPKEDDEDSSLYSAVRKEHVGEGEPFRLATTDRTVKRNLIIVRSVLCARHIRRTKQLPALDFEKFLRHSVDAEIRKRVEDLLKAKKNGMGDMEAGNPFKDLIESELNYDVDVDSLDKRGIKKERVNEFIKQADEFLW